jgi:hypothetical protein
LKGWVRGRIELKTLGVLVTIGMDDENSIAATVKLWHNPDNKDFQLIRQVKMGHTVVWLLQSVEFAHIARSFFLVPTFKLFGSFTWKISL